MFFLVRKKIRMIVENISLMMLYMTKKATINLIPYGIINGVKTVINIILIRFSTIFETTCGRTLFLPKK